MKSLNKNWVISKLHSTPALGTALLLLAAASLCSAEQVNRFVAKPGALKARIEGSSTIHDWRMESPNIGGYLEVGPGFPTEPGQEVKPGKLDAKVEAFIPVRSLKSLKEDNKTPYSDKMNEVAWTHLKQDKSPRITYRLQELVLKEMPKSKDAPYVFDSTGELVVGGVTNKISMPVNITPLGNKQLKITGDTKVKMSDFKIDPPAPTGLGLLIKTGDEVKVLFDWTVEQKMVLPAATKKE